MLIIMLMNRVRTFRAIKVTKNLSPTVEILINKNNANFFEKSDFA